MAKIKKFDVIVSNPPYQKTINKINSDIWFNFIETCNIFTNITVFIHPGRWVIPKQLMLKVQKNIIKSGLVYFDYLTEEVFPDVHINGNISITMFKNNNKNNKIFYSNNGEKFGEWNPDGNFFSNIYEKELYKHFENFLKHDSMKNYYIGKAGSLGRQEFGYSKKTHSHFLKETPEKMVDPVKIWASNTAGRSSKFKWFWIDKKYLKNDKNIETLNKLLTTRKVMVDKKGNAPIYNKKPANIFNKKAEIIGKNTLGESKLFFIPKTDCKEDLILISSLLNSKTARALMSITQKDLYTRGLENVPSYLDLKKLLYEDGLEKFSDDWFYSTFNFSPELINYIEKYISHDKLSLPLTDEEKMALNED